jgi:NAD(P)-dependent dehydrogenase (short-subunit alcohol dehydrogenase family)
MARAHWPPGVALITGAASGLGRELAFQLARDGTSIAALDCNEVGLESLGCALQASGAKWASEKADVTDAAALKKSVENFESRLGPIDLLIASAGIGQETSALNFPAETFASIIRVNLIGVANSIAAVLPGMLERRSGHLAALSSLASLRGLPFMAGYCASKAGVNALLESIRVEAAPRGVRTTIICPGWVRTPMTEHLKLPAGAVLEVTNAARLIIAALRQGKKFVAFPSGPARQLRLVRALPTSWGDWLLRRKIRR